MSDEEKKTLLKKLRYCEQEYEQNGYLSVGKFEAIKEAANLIEKQQKEIEELKTTVDLFKNASDNVADITQTIINKNYVSKDKIKPIQIIDLDGKIHNVYKIEEE